MPRSRRPEPEMPAEASRWWQARSASSPSGRCAPPSRSGRSPRASRRRATRPSWRPKTAWRRRTIRKRRPSRLRRQWWRFARPRSSSPRSSSSERVPRVASMTWCTLSKGRSPTTGRRPQTERAHASSIRSPVTEDASSAMHLRIRLGTEHYALDLDHVLEVVELGEVTPVPGSAATLIGIRNLRGELLPVLDLSASLGVAGESASRSLVVVADDDRRAGLAVDEVIDLSQLPEATARVDLLLVQGGVLVDGALVGVVDVSAMLASFSGSSETEL